MKGEAPIFPQPETRPGPSFPDGSPLGGLVQRSYLPSPDPCSHPPPDSPPLPGRTLARAGAAYAGLNTHRLFVTGEKGLGRAGAHGDCPRPQGYVDARAGAGVPGLVP